MLSKSHIPIIQQAGTILGLHPAKIVVVGTGFKCEDELIEMLRLNAYPTTHDGATALLPITTPKGHIATNKAKGASASAGGLYIVLTDDTFNAAVTTALETVAIRGNGGKPYGGPFAGAFLTMPLALFAPYSKSKPELAHRDHGLEEKGCYWATQARCSNEDAWVGHEGSIARAQHARTKSSKKPRDSVVCEWSCTSTATAVAHLAWQNQTQQ
jgi:hypothetical protein